MIWKDLVMSFSTRIEQSQTPLERSLEMSTENLIKRLRKLSSGTKISTASDGPASLVISEKLRAQIGSLNQEIENITANIDQYSYTSSLIMEERSKLTELRSMAIGAANSGGNSTETQEAYATAAQELVDSFNDLVRNSEYNGQRILDGSKGSLADISHLDDIDFSSPERVETSTRVIDNAINEVDAIQVDIGAIQKNSLESRRASLEVTAQNLIASESSIRDLDYASEYVQYISEMIQMKSSVALMAHSNINSGLVLNLLSS